MSKERKSPRRVVTCGVELCGRDCWRMTFPSSCNANPAGCDYKRYRNKPNYVRRCYPRRPGDRRGALVVSVPQNARGGALVPVSAPARQNAGPLPRSRDHLMNLPLNVVNRYLSVDTKMLTPAIVRRLLGLRSANARPLEKLGPMEILHYQNIYTHKSGGGPKFSRSLANATADEVKNRLLFNGRGSPKKKEVW